MSVLDVHNEKKGDLITVIVLTYNSSQTIVDTLESIKNQTYGNIELIVSDDHSKDNTVEVVKEWIKGNEDIFYNVRLLRARKNHGVTKNCNIGGNEAKGKYLQFLAGDDVLYENAIAKKYEFAEENNLNFVVSKVLVSGEDNDAVKSMNEFIERGYKSINSGLSSQIHHIEAENIIVGPSGCFYRKDFFIRQGMYDTRFPMLEDYPFIYKYLHDGYEIVLLDDVLAEYRLGNTSLCTSFKNKRFIDSYFGFYMIVRLPELIKQRRINVIVDDFKRYLYMSFMYYKFKLGNKKIRR